MTIGSLFGKSPITPIQKHMQQVLTCVMLLPELFQALEKGDFEKLEVLSVEISKREHDADLAKHEIRNNFPRYLFMPIDRVQLFEIVELQDKIADKVEDIAVIAGLKKIAWIDEITESFWAFLDTNIKAFEQTHQIIQQLHELSEFSFGGIEAEKIRDLILSVSQSEHEADTMQRPLLKVLFEDDANLSPATFHIWQQLFESVGMISNLSEQLALRIRTILEEKK